MIALESQAKFIGGKAKSMKKFLKFGCFGIIGLAVLIGIVSAIGGGGARSVDSTAVATTASDLGQTALPSATRRPEPTVAPTLPAPTVAPTLPEPTVAPTLPEPTAIPTPLPAIGQDVKFDKVRWKITSAQDLGNKLKSGNELIEDKTTAGRFIKIRFEIENLSNDNLYFTDFDLVDDQNRTYKSSSDVLLFIPSNEMCMLQNLNPNIPKTCTSIFEVPANARNLKAQVNDFGALFSKKVLIDLGLK